MSAAPATEITRIGVEFDVYGFIDGHKEYIGTRKSKPAAEQLAAEWRLEQAELASVVYARPAEQGDVAGNCPECGGAEIDERVFCTHCPYFATTTDHEGLPVCDFHTPPPLPSPLLPTAKDIKTRDIRDHGLLVRSHSNGDHYVEVYINADKVNYSRWNLTHYVIIDGAYANRYSGEEAAMAAFDRVVENWLPLEAQMAERELERRARAA
jgi:hypothetical protein